MTPLENGKVQKKWADQFFNKEHNWDGVIEMKLKLGKGDCPCECLYVLLTGSSDRIFVKT